MADALSLPTTNVTPGRLDLIGDDAIAPNADYRQDIDFDLDVDGVVTSVLDITSVSNWTVLLKTNREDLDADAVATGAAHMDDVDGEIHIYFLASEITPDMIGMYWWVLRGDDGGGDSAITQTFCHGKAEVAYL